MSRLVMYEGVAPGTPPAGVVYLYPKADGKFYFKASDGIERSLQPAGGDLLADGTTPLTAPWDAGPFKITAEQFESDIASGTAPFIVASNTLVTNLNADLLDGNEGSFYASVAYVDAAVVGLLDHKGGYDAATNTPDLDTSPSGIKQGDAYVVTVAGTFFTEAVQIGDWMYALQDDPTTLAHWVITEQNLDAASIKTLYESNADTNEFSDAEQTKLVGIETAAKDDQTDVEIETAYNNQVAAASQVEMEAGTETAIRRVSPLRVAQAIAALASGGMPPAEVKTANYTAVSNEVVPVDTSGGAFTITLPASPSAQDRIIIDDRGKSCGTTNCTIARNGKTIDGAAEDFVIDQDSGRVDLVYDGTSDWDTHLIGFKEIPVPSGTFAPTLLDSTLSDAEGQTYTEQTGAYRLVGDVCFFWLEMIVNSLGTLTTGDNASIGGLPYTAKAIGCHSPVAVGVGASLAITAGNTISGAVLESNDHISLQKWSATTGTVAMTVAEVSTGGRLVISGNYVVA